MSSLERLCLDLIVKKFERFYFAFTESKCEYVQRNFQFLQRRFSVQLTTALSVQKKLKEKYLEVLINEYLNFLLGMWLKNTRQLNSTNDIFSRLPNLTRICFRNCGDEILENIAKYCPKIVEIDVRHSNVSDNGVKYLYDATFGRIPCPELRNLFISPSLVTHRGAGCLIQSLSSLEKFDYPNYPLLLYSIHSGNLPEIINPHNYNLIELNLSEFPELSYYTEVLQTCVTVCSKLESIACYISDKEELNLLTNKNLKKLQLEFRIPDRKVNMDNFLQKSGCNLSSLKISNPPNRYDTSCNISVSVLAVTVSVLAVHCPVLKEFYAHNVNLIVDDDDDWVQVFFPSLIKCCFSLIDSLSTKAVCLLLSSAPKLESLSFRFMLMLPLELKSIVLTWCESPSANLIEFVSIDREEEFFADILLKSHSLKAMFLNQCYFKVSDINSFLRNFAKNLSNKPRIFVKKYNPWLCDLEDIRYISAINHDSLFTDRGHNNLENYLKEEYKYASIYDLLFTETVFYWNDSGDDSEDDWEDKWEIISF